MINAVSFSCVVGKLLYYDRAVVERLMHLTPDQDFAGSNPSGGLNFRVSESAVSTGKVIVISAHLPGRM